MRNFGITKILLVLIIILTPTLAFSKITYVTKQVTGIGENYRVALKEAFKEAISQVNGLTQETKSVLNTIEKKNAYTILHKLVFNIKKIFGKVPGLRTKLGTYAAALFLLKDTFKESVDDPDMFEKEFNDILNKEEEELSAKIGDKVIAYEDNSPVDTILGVEIFSVIHMKSKEKIYVSLEDIKE